MVVINGVLTHDVTITLRFPTDQSVKGNLILGAAWQKFGKLKAYQSEASVTRKLV